MSESPRSKLTLPLAVAGIGLSLIIAVFDGGNIDFYRRPLCVLWFVITTFSLFPKSPGVVSSYIRRAWWLQIVMPLAIFILSIILAHIHQPYRPYSYRFDHPSMIGMAKEDVINRVGKPTFIPEAGDGEIWIYQKNNDPEATITFDHGRVSEVWTAYTNGFTRPK